MKTILNVAFFNWQFSADDLFSRLKCEAKEDEAHEL